MSDSQRRLLLVEDDASSASTLAQLLREDGYVVEVLHDGPDALARLSRAPRIDALITDYRLPHSNGLVIADRGRQIDAQMPIFLVTSYPELVARMRAAPDPRLAVMSKPVAYADLLAALQSAQFSA